MRLRAPSRSAVHFPPFLPLALAVCAASCGYAGPDHDSVASTAAAITAGEPESGYPAVFSLAYEAQGGCTGTCITPRVGTTAAHCVEGDPASSFTALFGDEEEHPERILQVVAIAAAPDGADIALVAFAEDCPASIPFNRAPLEAHVGEPVVMVGFGVTTETAGDAGRKRSGAATLFSVTPAEVSGLEDGELATSNDPAGTCNGDSGGPTFMRFAGDERMVGTTSRGSLEAPGREWPCGQGRSIAVRADSYAAFIDEFIALHDPGAARAADAGAGVELTGGGAGSGCGVAGARSGDATWVAFLAALALAVRRRGTRRARWPLT